MAMSACQVCGFSMRRSSSRNGITQVSFEKYWSPSLLCVSLGEYFVSRHSTKQKSLFPLQNSARLHHVDHNRRRRRQKQKMKFVHRICEMQFPIFLLLIGIGWIERRWGRKETFQYFVDLLAIRPLGSVFALLLFVLVDVLYLLRFALGFMLAFCTLNRSTRIPWCNLLTLLEHYDHKQNQPEFRETRGPIICPSQAEWCLPCFFSKQVQHIGTWSCMLFCWLETGTKNGNILI